MSKPNRQRFKLETIRQQERDRTGDAFEIEANNGEVFEVPAPGFWPDEVKAAIASGDDLTAAKKLLGERRYLEFRQAGGQASDVLLALKAFAANQGTELGESSASSDS